MLPSMQRIACILLIALACGSCAGWHATERYDLIVLGGTVYDGSGAAARRADVGVRGDRIVAVGDLATAEATQVLQADGLAVAPGFINMLSWATESLLVDGQAASDVRQGVTLEVFGEGWSMGPLNDAMKATALEEQGDVKYPIEWTTLGQYLEHLERKGVAVNVASFVGATTLRIHELGYADRPPTEAELARMVALVDQAMAEGALGVGASLIYAPAFYAKTDELIALARAAGRHGGSYIAHMRSEGNRLLEAVDETLRIGREAGVAVEIYHLKAAGQSNWPKMREVIARIDAARAAGQAVTADMYAYPAGATGLDAAMPPWVQEGGLKQWIARLKDPTVRAKVAAEMRTPTDAWESLYLAAGSPERVLLVAFKNDALKALTGKSLAEVARLRGKSPEETAMDLVVEDGSRVGTVYFLMSEENLSAQFAKPWVSLGSDAEALAPEGVFLKSNPHPRAYGNFARFLAKYVREQQLMPLEEGIRRMTGLPAANLKLAGRGCVAVGCYADLAVFDAAKVQDHATFDAPHRYATGMVHVVVNGQAVLASGAQTPARPGRVLRGPGWKPKG
jgi:N-acyl-D-amino-acid deacylase